MNEDVKKLWVDALRSGTYEQGFGGLHPREKFCCLGVLCDLYIKETGSAEWHRGYFQDKVTGIGGGGYLPLTVQDWAEIETGDPYTHPSRASLSAMNDDGMPFTEIADLIEKYL